MDGQRQAPVGGGAPVQTLHGGRDRGVPDTGDAEREQVAGVCLTRRQPHLGTVGEQLLAERRLGHERRPLRHGACEPPATVAQEHTVGWVGRGGGPTHRVQSGVVERAVVAGGGLCEQRPPGAALLELRGAGRAALAQVARLVPAEVHPPRGLRGDPVPDGAQKVLDPAARRQSQVDPSVVEGRVGQVVVSVNEPRQQRTATEVGDKGPLAHRPAHLGERADRRDPSRAGPDRLGEGAPRIHRVHHRPGEDLGIHRADRM